MFFLAFHVMSKSLPDKFRRDGNEFRLLEKGDRYMIYEGYPIGHKEGTDVFYEYFEIRVDAEGNEVYPDDDAFGDWAWASFSLDKVNSNLVKKGLK